MSPEKALYELLCDLFAARELLRFIRQNFKRLSCDLSEGAPITDLADTVAGLLERHGQITLDLFERLAAERPDRRPEIAATAKLWKIILAPAAAPSAPAASPAVASATTTTAASTDATSSPPPPATAPTTTTSPVAPADPAPEVWHAFISYAAADSVEVRRIAENLHRLGLDVFFDQWEIDAGTVVSQRLDQGLRGSRTGVLVVSRTSVQRPWVLQEYTVLLEKAVKHNQRLIPVLLEDADLPPMLATRRHIDLRGKRGPDYIAAIHELAAAIRGDKPQKPPRGGPLQTP